MRLVILGAGGFAKEVADLAVTLGHDVVGFVDERGTGARQPTGRPVVHSIAHVADAFDGYVIAIGDGLVRQRFAGELGTDMEAPTLVHPSASVSPHASLGRGSLVMQNCVINADASVGAFTIVNVGACVAHDVVVGDAVHIAPAVQLAGGSSVGDLAFVGTGAVVLPGVSVGDRGIVGAGSVVTRDVESGTTVVGVPGRLRGHGR